MDPEVLKNDVPELQEQLVSACQSIVQVGQNVVYTNAEFGFRLFWALSQVIASSPPDADVHAEVFFYGSCCEILIQSRLFVIYNVLLHPRPL